MAGRDGERDGGENHCGSVNTTILCPLVALQRPKNQRGQCNELAVSVHFLSFLLFNALNVDSMYLNIYGFNTLTKCIKHIREEKL